ncbi:ATP-dependent RNA helicase RhlE [Alphaproteobacteria bacterium SO-S41]|nr:ATP-dependent RNA helicase RhlE [Alphaproteobacteria bacterium SO-S41]
MTTFADLGLSDELLKAVEDTGYTTPTPIQEQAIPHVLRGRDVLGLAQTGTGKTAGFTLPMIDILASGRAKARMPRSLILEPTRELAAQVSESFVKYGKHHKLTQALIIGGVAFGDQDKKLDRGVDVLIATPGRLLDQFERSKLMLSQVQVLVIDEADRMLDMGFVPDIERIVKLLPFTRQTLFFSATMPPEITRLADQFLHNPVRIEVSKPATAATTIEQRLTVIDAQDKREALRRLIRAEPVQNAIVFCNRKRDVDIVGKSLKKHGFDAAPIHGDLDQATRTATLDLFRAGGLQILVASDVAARGLDVPTVSHVFNFDVPIHSDDYVHRIGRTGRAGRSGISITLATPHDGKYVDAIEKLTGKPIERFKMEGLEDARREPREGDGAGDKRARDRKARERTRKFDRAPAPRAIEDGVSMEAFRPDPEAIAAAAAVVRDEPAAPAAREEKPRAARPPRAPRNRDGEPRAPKAEAAPPREEKPRAEKPRNDRPRRDDKPAAPASAEDKRRDRRERYGKDDLGPSVVGFGDHMPAFLNVVVPRIWEKPARQEDTAEMPAPETSSEAEAA